MIPTLSITFTSASHNCSYNYKLLHYKCITNSVILRHGIVYKSYVINYSTIRFANSLEEGDPLKTLYQLMSGRVPDVAKVCISCLRWTCVYVPIISDNVSFETVSLPALWR